MFVRVFLSLLVFILMITVQPQFLTFCFIASQRYPIVAAVSAFVVVLSRYFYAWGYYTGNPDGRYRGAFGYFGFFALLGCTMMYGFNELGVDFGKVIERFVK